MTDHNVDRRITDALRAYEASIPEEELAMSTPPRARSRWPVRLAAVTAGTLAGVVLAVLLLNRPDAPVGAEDPSPTPASSADATPTTDATTGPSPSTESTPLPSAPGEETRSGWEATRIGADNPASVNAAAPWGDGLMLLGRSETTLGGIWLSEDGRTWTVADVPESPEGTAVFMTDAIETPNGFAAVGTLGHPEGSGPMGSVLWTSADGRSWTEPPSAVLVRERLLSVLAASGDTVVAAGNAVWRSSDGGSTWLPAVTPDALGGTITDLVVHNDRFVGTGYLGDAISGGSAAAVWTSGDGLTWSRAELDGDSATSLAPLPDGRLLAVGEGGNQVLAWTSEDGSSWEPIAIEAPCCITDLAATPTGIVGVGFGPQPGAVSFATTDARTWTQEIGIPATINDLIHHPRFGLVGGGADQDNGPSLILGPHPYP